MVNEKFVKSVLNKHKKRDSWFLDEYSVNPYEGCSFNCLYCYIRGSKYGLNMAETFSVKANAAEILEKQLRARAKKNQYGIVALASATDPYLPIEAERKLTQQFLELFLKYKFPIFVATKSKMILRDVELLKEIDANAILPDDLKNTLRHGAIVTFSISTLDENISAHLESGAAKPLERFETMKRCKDEGLFVGVNCIPVLPFLSDSDEKLEEMISAAKHYGADFILVCGLTLFGDGIADSKTLYFQFLKKYFPQLVPKYQQIFSGNYLPYRYENDLRMRARKLCEKYKFRNSIL
ncbi:MAG: radical SAM protein [Ignavibacteria bacterium]|nr:radical SAM protein [Ignavibacteria bacterium]